MDPEDLEDTVRMTDETPIRAAVYDLIKCATGDKYVNPKELLDKLCQQKNVTIDMSDYTFPTGQTSPVAGVKGVEQVLALLPGQYAAAFRRNEGRLLIYSMQSGMQVA